jgi:hypothetical protein
MGELDEPILPLLPVADVVVAFSVFEAILVSRQLRKLGYQTPVAHLPPPIDIRRYTHNPIHTLRIGHQQNIDHKVIADLLARAIELSAGDRGSISAYLHVYTPVWPFDALEALCSGKPVITTKRPPLTEYITDGFNGFLARDRHDILNAVQELSSPERRFVMGAQARGLASTLFDPARYVAGIMNVARDQFYNMNMVTIPDVDRANRKWLFRKQSLRQGKVVMVPEQYDASFGLSNLVQIHEILSFLLQQQFQCAYVFDFDLGDPTIAEFNQVLSTAERLGRRGLNIHFCTDEPIPERWRDVFKNLSVISVVEGLKQVSGSI